MFKWPGGPRKTLPGGSLKYLFVYLKVRIFKCSYRSSKQTYILILMINHIFAGEVPIFVI